jgi:hypothetical protein
VFRLVRLEVGTSCWCDCSGLVSQGDVLLGTGGGITRGGRRLNARNGRLRALVPRENAVARLDLREEKQALAVTGAGGLVLARRAGLPRPTVPVRCQDRPGWRPPGPWVFMIAKGFAPFSGAKPFMIMGAPHLRLLPLPGAVLPQAPRPAAGDADHPLQRRGRGRLHGLRPAAAAALAAGEPAAAPGPKPPHATPATRTRCC